MRNIPDNSLAYPVLIERSNGSGSGFFVNSERAVYLVTARHVLFDERGRLQDDTASLTFYGDGLQQLGISLDLAQLRASQDIEGHVTADVAAVRIGVRAGEQVNMLEGVAGIGPSPTPENRFVSAGVEEFCDFDQVLISNEVFVFGYPDSVGMPDQIDRSRPLLRHGIVAGTNAVNSTIIIDCAVCQGSSGGMVIQVDRESMRTTYKIFGVVTTMVPFVESFKSLEYGTINRNVGNSGYAVVESSDRIRELINIIEAWDTAPGANPAAKWPSLD